MAFTTFAAVAEDDAPRLRELIQDDKDVDFIGRDGSTALHQAASLGAVDCARVLLRAGADVNAADFESFWTPLHRAVYFQQTGMVFLLLSYGASLGMRDKEGFTPLELAGVLRQQGLAALRAQCFRQRSRSSFRSRHSQDLEAFLERAEGSPKQNRRRPRSSSWGLYAALQEEEADAEVTGGNGNNDAGSDILEHEDNTLTGQLGSLMETRPASSSSVASSDGHQHECATDSVHDVQVFAWGKDEMQLGLPSTGLTAVQSTPRPIAFPPSLATTPVTQLATSRHHSLALCGDGRVLSWGLGRGGRLGRGDERPALTPRLVSFPTSSSAARSSAPATESSPSTRCVAVATGSGHSLALTEEGHVWAWGTNVDGECGLGIAAESVLQPRAIDPGSFRRTRIVGIAAGKRHSVFIGADGSAWATGSNDSEQLGRSRSGPQGVSTARSPLRIPQPEPRVQKKKGRSGAKETGGMGVGVAGEESQRIAWVGASAGSTHTLLRAGDGSVWMVGADRGSKWGSSAPVMVKFDSQAANRDECVTRMRERGDIMPRTSYEARTRVQKRGTSKRNRKARGKRRNRQLSQGSDGGEPAMMTSPAPRPQGQSLSSSSLEEPGAILWRRPRGHHSWLCITMVASGTSDCFALDEHGSVWHWEVDHADRRPVARRLATFQRQGHAAASIVAREDHFAAVTLTGQLYVWGRCDGSSTGASREGTPDQVVQEPKAVPSLARVVDAAVGPAHTFAIVAWQPPHVPSASVAAASGSEREAVMPGLAPGLGLGFASLEEDEHPHMEAVVDQVPRWDIPSLQSLCEDTLIREIRKETVEALLEAGDMAPRLAVACGRWICDNLDGLLARTAAEEGPSQKRGPAVAGGNEDAPLVRASTNLVDGTWMATPDLEALVTARRSRMIAVRSAFRDSQARGRLAVSHGDPTDFFGSWEALQADEEADEGQSSGEDFTAPLERGRDEDLSEINRSVEKLCRVLRETEQRFPVDLRNRLVSRGWTPMDATGREHDAAPRSVANRPSDDAELDAYLQLGETHSLEWFALAARRVTADGAPVVRKRLFGDPVEEEKVDPGRAMPLAGTLPPRLLRAIRDLLGHLRIEWDKLLRLIRLAVSLADPGKRVSRSNKAALWERPRLVSALLEARGALDQVQQLAVAVSAVSEQYQTSEIGSSPPRGVLQSIVEDVSRWHDHLGTVAAMPAMDSASLAEIPRDVALAREGNDPSLVVGFLLLERQQVPLVDERPKRCPDAHGAEKSAPAGDTDDVASKANDDAATDTLLSPSVSTSAWGGQRATRPGNGPKQTLLFRIGEATSRPDSGSGFESHPALAQGLAGMVPGSASVSPPAKAKPPTHPRASPWTSTAVIPSLLEQQLQQGQAEKHARRQQVRRQTPPAKHRGSKTRKSSEGSADGSVSSSRWGTSPLLQASAQSPASVPSIESIQAAERGPGWSARGGSAAAWGGSRGSNCTPTSSRWGRTVKYNIGLDAVREAQQAEGVLWRQDETSTATTTTTPGGSEVVVSSSNAQHGKRERRAMDQRGDRDRGQARSSGRGRGRGRSRGNERGTRRGRGRGRGTNERGRGRRNRGD